MLMEEVRRSDRIPIAILSPVLTGFDFSIHANRFFSLTYPKNQVTCRTRKGLLLGQDWFKFSKKWWPQIFFEKNDQDDVAILVFQLFPTSLGNYLK